MKKRNYFAILNSTVSDFLAKLAESDPPTSQDQSLATGNVLVEKFQWATSSGSGAGTDSNVVSASEAMRTTSLIASSFTFPSQSPMMVCQSSPLATCASTVLTRMRVPRKVGLPWQIRGSATMYLPNSFGS